MNFQQCSKLKLVSIGLVIMTMAAAAFAQTAGPTPSVVIPVDNRPVSVARGSNLYCAGYIQQSPVSTGNRIIGSDQEAETYNYDLNDLMYINMGSNKGVNVGDTFAVIRPRGKVSSRWTKKSDIGFYVEEVGALEVVRVKSDVSVARIKSSCDGFLLGDLVQVVEKRNSPLVEMRPALDLFSDPSGKARGRIVMSRDHAEMLARDFIAYVDLGLDDNVRVGDRLTVFRPLGKGNITQVPQKESVSARDDGFESDVYHGGKFSNQAGRKSGDKADGRMVTTAMAKEGRPNLRKIVGEAVVLNVKERTATIVITRTAQEIHTGDWVELQ
ncbi:MAG: hypothetical protein ABJA02_06500 [Acidobacteriota bacterium]